MPSAVEGSLGGLVHLRTGCNTGVDGRIYRNKLWFVTTPLGLRRVATRSNLAVGVICEPGALSLKIPPFRRLNKKGHLETTLSCRAQSRILLGGLMHFRTGCNTDGDGRICVCHPWHTSLRDRPKGRPKSFQTIL